MKVLFRALLLSLLLFASLARAEGPDDQYVHIFNLIQDADSLNDHGDLPAAMTKYAEAQTALKRFQAGYPNWNPKVVKFRLDYLASKITELSLKTAPPPAATPTNTPTPPPPATPKPPAAPVTNSPPPVAVTEPVQSIAPAERMIPAPVVSPTPPPALSTEAENQIKGLQERIRNMETDKALLEAKLREALSAQPAAMDPRESQKAQDQIKNLQKENELLKVSLAQAKAAATAPAAFEETKKALAEANARLVRLADDNTRLAKEKETLQTRVKASAVPDPAMIALREENEILKKQMAALKTNSASADSDLNRKLLAAQNQIAVLESDKEVLNLEKTALENRVRQVSVASASGAAAPAAMDTATADKIKQLEVQRDELQKSLASARDEITAGKKKAEKTTEVADMTRELSSLRARIDVLEATRVPYTEEELALFSKPEPKMLVAAVHAPAKKPGRQLPAEAGPLLTEARKYVLAGQLDKAEEKYLEVYKMDNENVSVLVDMATLQVQQGHLIDAEKNVNAALALDPDNKNCIFVLGQLRFEEANYDAALEAFSRLAELSPDDSDVQNYLGITLSEKGLRGPAETALRKAMQIDPRNGDAHANLASIYITQKPPLVELAQWHYQKAIAAGHARSPETGTSLEFRQGRVHGRALKGPACHRSFDCGCPTRGADVAPGNP